MILTVDINTLKMTIKTNTQVKSLLWRDIYECKLIVLYRAKQLKALLLHTVEGSICYLLHRNYTLSTKCSVRMCMYTIQQSKI